MREAPAQSARLIYAAGEKCADQLYASGVMTPDPFLWYQVGNQTGIIISPLEFGRAQKSAAEDVLVLSTELVKDEWQLETPVRKPELLIQALSERMNVKSWNVPENFPLGLATRVQELGIQLRPITSFFPERQVKNKAEIEKIREGVHLAERGMERAIQIIGACHVTHEGILEWKGHLLTSEMLAGEIDAEIIRNGGTATGTIAASGPQSADPHEAGHGPIRAEQPIVIDIFPRVNRTGYFGDLTRTVLKGKAPQHVKKAFAAVYDAQQAAIQKVQAGVPCTEIHRLVQECFDSNGFETSLKASPPFGFIHSTGHGLGLEVHELPRVGDKAEDVLTKGNVVTIEPGLYYPEWGGIRLEDVVAVTDDGCENLTSASVILEIP